MQQDIYQSIAARRVVAEVVVQREGKIGDRPLAKIAAGGGLL